MNEPRDIYEAATNLIELLQQVQNELQTENDRLAAENERLREAAHAALAVWNDYRIDSTEEIREAEARLRALLKE